jgi:SWI/SNF-related matrix-associated actin-dependent regulator of chromatin subfamily A member 5
LPADGEIEGIGASLPELEILGYPETKQGYYIRCPDCVARFAKPKDEEERNWTESWKRELASANKKWEMGDLETEEKEVV